SPRTPEREPAVAEIRADDTARAAADRHDAFLVALAEHAHDTVFQVEVAELEPDRLADADAGGIEHLEQRAVALAERAVARHSTQLRLDLRLVECLRDSLRYPRRVDLLAWVGRQQTLGCTEPVERAHRDERPGDRRGREHRLPVVVAEGAEVPDVVLHRLLAD